MEEKLDTLVAYGFPFVALKFHVGTGDWTQLRSKRRGCG